MWIAISAAVMVLSWSGCYSLVQAIRRRPAGAALALSAALLICLEASLIHLLSPWSAVGRPWLLLGNAGMGVAGLRFGARRSRRRMAPPWRFIAAQTRLAWVAPLGLLAALAALEWLPNNWDSMTYHLGRVGYWIQYRSVLPYPTGIDRQIRLPPGAEYLMLSLQAVAGSDRLDNLVQLASWFALVLAAAPLARAMGAPRKAAAWAGVLVGTLPLGLLEASSSQNDLVAALVAVAIVAACLPFLHDRRWRWTDVVLLWAAAGAGALVKPTALLAASPYLAWALFAGARTLRRSRDWAALARGQAVATALVLAAVGPAVLASLSMPEPAALVRPYLYLGLADPADRVINSLRGVARNVPVPEALERAIAPEKTLGCPAAGLLCVDSILRMHEDFAGNVGQALVVMAALLLGAISWPGLPRRSRLALLALPAAWILFHGVFRDNAWYSRLQLPLFGQCGLSLVCLARKPGRRAPGLGALPLLATLLASWGALAVCRNEVREPKLVPEEIRFAGSSAAYYLSALPGVEAKHDAVLAALAATGCRKLGLWIGGDSYDYPLSWRAMKAGAAVHHLLQPDDWPCLVFSDRGPPPPRSSGRWEQVRAFLYLAR